MSIIALDVNKELLERYKDSELVDDLIQRKTDQKMYQADENFPTREVEPVCICSCCQHWHLYSCDKTLSCLNTHYVDI